MDNANLKEKINMKTSKTDKELEDMVRNLNIKENEEILQLSELHINIDISNENTLNSNVDFSVKPRHALNIEKEQAKSFDMSFLHDSIASCSSKSKNQKLNLCESFIKPWSEHTVDKIQFHYNLRSKNKNCAHRLVSPNNTKKKTIYSGRDSDLESVVTLSEISSVESVGTHTYCLRPRKIKYEATENVKCGNNFGELGRASTVSDKSTASSALTFSGTPRPYNFHSQNSLHNVDLESMTTLSEVSSVQSLSTHAYCLRPRKIKYKTTENVKCGNNFRELDSASTVSDKSSASSVLTFSGTPRPYNFRSQNILHDVDLESMTTLSEVSSTQSLSTHAYCFRPRKIKSEATENVKYGNNFRELDRASTVSDKSLVGSVLTCSGTPRRYNLRSQNILHDADLESMTTLSEVSSVQSLSTYAYCLCQRNITYKATKSINCGSDFKELARASAISNISSKSNILKFSGNYKQYNLSSPSVLHDAATSHELVSKYLEQSENLPVSYNLRTRKTSDNKPKIDTRDERTRECGNSPVLCSLHTRTNCARTQGSSSKVYDNDITFNEEGNREILNYSLQSSNLSRDANREGMVSKSNHSENGVLKLQTLSQRPCKRVARIKIACNYLNKSRRDIGKILKQNHYNLRGHQSKQMEHDNTGSEVNDLPITQTQSDEMQNDNAGCELNDLSLTHTQSEQIQHGNGGCELNYLPLNRKQSEEIHHGNAVRKISDLSLIQTQSEKMEDDNAVCEVNDPPLTQSEQVQHDTTVCKVNDVPITKTQSEKMQFDNVDCKVNDLLLTQTQSKQMQHDNAVCEVNNLPLIQTQFEEIEHDNTVCKVPITKTQSEKMQFDNVDFKVNGLPLTQIHLPEQIEHDNAVCEVNDLPLIQTQFEKIAHDNTVSKVNDAPITKGQSEQMQFDNVDCEVNYLPLTQTQPEQIQHNNAVYEVLPTTQKLDNDSMSLCSLFNDKLKLDDKNSSHVTQDDFDVNGDNVKEETAVKSKEKIEAIDNITLRDFNDAEAISAGTSLGTYINNNYFTVTL